MKSYNQWIEENLGIVLMLSSIPATVIIVVSYYDTLISNSIIVLAVSFTALLLNFLAILYTQKKGGRTAIHIVWLVYTIAMGVLLFVKIAIESSNRLNTLIFYLIGIAYYFLFGFEYKNRKKTL
jgi:hypothetical protein